MLRPTLVLLSLATYLVSPDDVIWRYIKPYPSARLIEHFAFGFAASLLGVALFLRVQANVSGTYSPVRTTIANSFEAVGIGFLLSMPGFLLLVLSDLGITLLQVLRQSAHLKQSAPLQTRPWTRALAEHMGLCCAFMSMIVFSVVLIDRVADALFAASALMSIIASVHRASQKRSHAA